jgi:hypothetical protein
MTSEQEKIKARVLERFGGLRAVAKICGLRTASAVCQWRGVPSKHQSTLLAYARKHGMDFGPEDFFLVRKTKQAAQHVGSSP